MFTHHAKRNGALMIVSYHGSITDRMQPPMDGFDQAVDGLCSGVVLDLSGIEYLNSKGVSSLLETFTYVRSVGINTVICSPIPLVLKVLKLARTELLVPVTESRSTASSLLHTLTQHRTNPARENILLVQGNVDIQENFRDVLKQSQQEANYNIITSLSPARAWKILGGKNIQLVIVDVTIPANEGHHFLKQVRTNRELKGLPFLVASDERNLPQADYYTKNGADDILRYPFNPYETPIRLRTALSLYYNWQKTIALGGMNRNPHDRPLVRG